MSTQTNTITSANKIPMKKAIIMYIIVSLFLMFEMGVQVSPSVMAPQLMESLNIGALGLGVMSGCYFYTYTAMQIPSGILFDRINPRTVITTAILVCSLGCLTLSFADSFLFGCAARLLMGFGSAFAFVSVLVVTADLFPHKYFAFMTGITQTLVAIGAMSGQVPTHFLVETFGWRNTLLGFAVIGFILAIAVFCVLQYKRDKHISTQAQNAPSILSNLKILVAKKQTWIVALYACLTWAPMSGFASLWGVPFLTHAQNLTAGEAALVCSMMWVGVAVASPLSGYIATHFNQTRACLTVAAALGAISFIALVFFHIHSLLLLGFLLFLAGAACSGQGLSFALAKNNHPKYLSATAIAFNNMAVVISGALFQPFIGWIIHLMANSSEAIQYKTAISVVLAAYVIAFITGSFLIKLNQSSATEEFTIE